MWVNFTVRSVKPSVRWMERWGSEGGREDCKLGESGRPRAGAGRWETLAEAGGREGGGDDVCRHTDSHTYKNVTCVHGGIHTVYVQILDEVPEHASACRNADARTRAVEKKKEKIGCVCKQSPHQSLHERSKSTLAVAPFHAIPQLSHTIPTSHLHIKQGSHSHALTNDFWMLLALHITTALQTCAVLPPYVEAKKKIKKIKSPE